MDDSSCLVMLFVMIVVVLLPVLAIGYLIVWVIGMIAEVVAWICGHWAWLVAAAGVIGTVILLVRGIRSIRARKRAGRVRKERWPSRRRRGAPDQQPQRESGSTAPMGVCMPKALMPRRAKQRRTGYPWTSAAGDAPRSQEAQASAGRLSHTRRRVPWGDRHEL